MSIPEDGPFRLEIGRRCYDLRTRALIMGIINRTPDSFYDKGRYFDLDASLKRAEELAAAGADILDVGGVKAGPGPFVTPLEEMERVCPAIEALASRFEVPVSVDTFTAEVADAALAAGAEMVNDISGLGDPEMPGVVQSHQASVVVTHIQGRPRVANPDPRYVDLVGEVLSFLIERTEIAREAGIAPSRILVDAGLDLGKSPEQSLTLLRETGTLLDLGYPVLLSSSNKGFIGEILGLDLDERVGATAATVAWAVIKGARVVRVHEVALMSRLCQMLDALLSKA